ncbi:uncharacterized protein LOC120328179 [Styela clava]
MATTIYCHKMFKLLFQIKTMILIGCWIITWINLIEGGRTPSRGSSYEYARTDDDEPVYQTSLLPTCAESCYGNVNKTNCTMSNCLIQNKLDCEKVYYENATPKQRKYMDFILKKYRKRRYKCSHMMSKICILKQLYIFKQFVYVPDYYNQQCDFCNKLASGNISGMQVNCPIKDLPVNTT